MRPRPAFAPAVSAGLTVLAVLPAAALAARQSPPYRDLSPFYVPVVIGAGLLGWPGALAAAAAASALSWLALGQHPGQAARLWWEMALFFACGGIMAGINGKGGAEVEGLAFRDPLTGLPLQSVLADRFGGEVARAAGDTPLSLLLFDIDGLASVNERLGRRGGDDALRATAEVIRRAIRAVDVPARLQDDEFAVLLPDTSPAGAALVADRIRRAVEARAEETSLRFTISGGVQVLDGGGAHSAIGALTEHLACAEAALREARRTGRNRVVFYDPEMFGK